METLIEQKRTSFARMLDLPGEEPTVSLTLVTSWAHVKLGTLKNILVVLNLASMLKVTWGTIKS